MVESNMRICGFHAVAIFGRDTESLQDAVEVVLVRHPLIASGIVCRERGRSLLTVPIAGGLFTTDHERLIVAAHAVSGRYRRSGIHGTGVAGVLAVVLIYGGGDNTGSERRRSFFLIANAAALGRILS